MHRGAWQAIIHRVTKRIRATIVDKAKVKSGFERGLTPNRKQVLLWVKMLSNSTACYRETTWPSQSMLQTSLLPSLRKLLHPLAFSNHYPDQTAAQISKQNLP